MAMCCILTLPPSFFTAPATTEIYTLSLHDALPISSDHGDLDRKSAGACDSRTPARRARRHGWRARRELAGVRPRAPRSEEHTSELQSQSNLVCRLLLEKKKKSARSRALGDAGGVTL